MVKLQQMSDALKKIYNACDPYKPATDEYYCDCATARGESALVQRFLRHLNLSQVPLCFLFSGHIGCGKSSELGQLGEALENPAAGCARYFPILLDVSDYLDDYDVATTDIVTVTNIQEIYFGEICRQAGLSVRQAGDGTAL